MQKKKLCHLDLLYSRCALVYVFEFYDIDCEMDTSRIFQDIRKLVGWISWVLSSPTARCIKAVSFEVTGSHQVNNLKNT